MNIRRSNPNTHGRGHDHICMYVALLSMPPVLAWGCPSRNPVRTGPLDVTGLIHQAPEDDTAQEQASRLTSNPRTAPICPKATSETSRLSPSRPSVLAPD